MSDRAQVERIIQYFMARYPGKFQPIGVGEFTTVDVWADELADVPADALLAAARQHVGEWPPDAGQLRNRAIALTRPALPDWGEAWGEVLTAITRYGSYNEPVAERWVNPLIPQVIRGMGGWKMVCAMETENIPTERAQFRMLYEAAASRATRAADLLPDVRELAIKNGALPAPLEPTPKALPAPVEAPRIKSDAPRSIASVLPFAVKTGAVAPKNADDEYRERVRRAKADPSGPEAQAFAAQAERMRQAARVMAARQTEQEATRDAV